ncbi:hypothetical protein ACI3PL_21275, partial [Lacticaseibacillus paracasei]
ILGEILARPNEGMKPTAFPLKSVKGDLRGLITAGQLDPQLLNAPFTTFVGMLLAWLVQGA